MDGNIAKLLVAITTLVKQNSELTSTIKRMELDNTKRIGSDTNNENKEENTKFTLDG